MSELAELIGVYAASRLTAQIPELIFRQQPEGDTGLNAHLEVVEDYPNMGKVVGLRVLTSDNSSVERTARGYTCRGDMPHVAYWLQHSLPVIVMVYERDEDRIIWESAGADTIEITGDHWELAVPQDQTYGPWSVERISDIPCYSPYLARLALDRPWMQIIENESEPEDNFANHTQGLLLEMDEWLNQPSARGSLRLTVLSPSGNREAVYEWPFQTNPDMPHVFRLPSLFPWAQIEIDQAFYKSKRGTAPAQGAIVPWQIEAGGIAKFQLRLSLNDLGRSFMTTEKFLRRGDFPLTPMADMNFGPEYESGVKFQLWQKKQ